MGIVAAFDKVLFYNPASKYSVLRLKTADLMIPDEARSPYHYGSDVPDDLCYQWAEDYFRDPDAKEDHQEEEEFVPKPYYGKTTSKSSGKKVKKAEPKKENKKPEPPKAPASDQITLGDLGMLEASA